MQQATAAMSDTLCCKHEARMSRSFAVLDLQVVTDRSVAMTARSLGCDAEQTMIVRVLQSTSGVKARAASDSAPSQGPGASSGRTGPGGAADRAEARFESESAAGQTPKKSGNEGFRV